MTDEVKTIGEVERIVLASGLWNGTSPIEFSDDGREWHQAWVPSEGHPHPEFARVAAHRKEVSVPVQVVIRWDEQVPRQDPDWLARWHASPTRHFGRTARIVAYRQAFRDLLGAIVIDEETADRPAEPAARDYAAEFAAADSVDALMDIVRAARKARAFSTDEVGVALDRAWRARKRELEAAPEPAPVVEPLAEVDVARLAERFEVKRPSPAALAGRRRDA